MLLHAGPIGSGCSFGKKRFSLNAPDRSQGWTGEDEEFVQRVLNELDPLLREAFLLKYIEEMSYEEMSALTGVGVSALKMRVKRACDRLRERWETNQE